MMPDKPAYSSLIGRIADFAHDARGAAALEFAFIAPLMIAMYFVTVEVTQAIDTNRKLTRLSSTVADLITQETKTRPEDLKAILSIGDQVLQPYRRTVADIRAEGIQVTSSGAKVVWAAKFEKGKFSMVSVGKNAKTTVPPEFNADDTFVVKAEASLDYRPLIAWTAEKNGGAGFLGAFDGIRMSDVFYLRPRVSTEVKCEGC